MPATYSHERLTNQWKLIAATGVEFDLFNRGPHEVEGVFATSTPAQNVNFGEYHVIADKGRFVRGIFTGDFYARLQTSDATAVQRCPVLTE